VINFVSDLRQAGVFFSGTPVSATNKTDRHDIAKILWKVELNTTNQTYNNNKHNYGNVVLFPIS
jgi:hypothetical protein